MVTVRWHSSHIRLLARIAVQTVGACLPATRLDEGPARFAVGGLAVAGLRRLATFEPDVVNLLVDNASKPVYDVVVVLSPVQHFVRADVVDMVQVHLIEDVVRCFLQQDGPQRVSLRRGHGLDERLQVLLQLGLREALVVVRVQGREDRMHAGVGAALEEDREAARPFAKAQRSVLVEVDGVEDLVELHPVLVRALDSLHVQELVANRCELVLVELAQALQPAPPVVLRRQIQVGRGLAVCREAFSTGQVRVTLEVSHATSHHEGPVAALAADASAAREVRGWHLVGVLANQSVHALVDIKLVGLWRHVQVSDRFAVVEQAFPACHVRLVLEISLATPHYKSAVTTLLALLHARGKAGGRHLICVLAGHRVLARMDLKVLFNVVAFRAFGGLATELRPAFGVVVDALLDELQTLFDRNIAQGRSQGQLCLPPQVLANEVHGTPWLDGVQDDHSLRAVLEAHDLGATQEVHGVAYSRMVPHSW
mmetsp:Transcript_124449/g.346441  ORF Transcript_124449/g.346441 Transcript_124449/m.346441 type:complete len:482 (+) Transcript_124449:827-2272(+)